MNFKKVAETEKRFAEIALSGVFQLSEPQTINFPKEPHLTPKMIKCTRLEEKKPYFFKEQFEKKQIVLHYTMGHLQGDMLSLTGEERRFVSVPYVIARDGTIYRLFGSDFWAYHIGPNDFGSNKTLSGTSIGIELSNYGPLKLGDNDELRTYYYSPTYNDVYCHLSDTDQYIKLPKPYRGYTYYAAYTAAQYDSLIVLLRYLTSVWGIKRSFLSEDIRHELTKHAVGFNGITSHVNYRKDKYDIGPAFDWKKVTEGVLADKYVSQKHRVVTTRGGAKRSNAVIERSLDDPLWYEDTMNLSDTEPEADV